MTVLQSLVNLPKDGNTSTCNPYSHFENEMYSGQVRKAGKHDHPHMVTFSCDIMCDDILWDNILKAWWVGISASGYVWRAVAPFVAFMSLQCTTVLPSAVSRAFAFTAPV